MGSKSTDWRPGPTVCRCCLSEGCYKDISTEYFWMGKREVYAEMLSETFSLSVAYSQSGGPNSNSRLICEPCISRLRDASDFRRQVQECEKTFMAYLDPGSSVGELEVTAEPVETPVKMERVKLEKEASDDDFDDRGGFDDDDDDDLDDQPLTKLASKVPKKESVDLLDLLDNAKAGEKRKSSAKAKTPAAKKSKGKKESKATSSKAPKPEKKKKDQSVMAITRRNAEIILQNTTAYPFKVLDDSRLVCVYCCERFSSGSPFREHIEAHHPEVNIRVAFAHVSHNGYLKVECTDVQCRLCYALCETIEDIAAHLIEEHDMTDLDPSYFLGVMPFKLCGDLTCAICDTKATCLRALSRHTQAHFPNFSCELCGKTFATMVSLRRHVKYVHTISNLQCKMCLQKFAFREDLKEHHLLNKTCCRNLCRICGDRFYSFSKKQTHMAEVHGLSSKKFKCRDCGEAFGSHEKLRTHFVIEHTEDYHQCPYCDEKFYTEGTLQRHIVVHTGEKQHQCPECHQSFFRKSTLNLHMWIHSDIKKYECAICDKHFNQKVLWNRHIKKYHPDLEEYMEVNETSTQIPQTK